MRPEHRKSRRVISIASALIILIFVGCTRTVNPQPHFLPDNALPELKLSKSVSLENLATAREVEKFCGMAAGSQYEFTQTAISIASDALTKKGMRIETEGEKTLKLELVAGCNSWSGIVSAELNVETGTGSKKEFIARRPVPSAYILSLAFERAVASVVKDMLNDQDIIDYLGN